MDRSFKHSTVASNPTLVGIRGVPVEQTCILESILMSLEIRLNSWALRASNSSSESQKCNGSGIIEGEVVEVAAWLEVASKIGVSSLVGDVIVAVEGTARASKSSVLATKGAGDKGVAVELVAFFTISFSFSCSFLVTFSSSFSLSFSFSCPMSYNETRH